jgi:hypothetical protein
MSMYQNIAINSKYSIYRVGNPRYWTVFVPAGADSWRITETKSLGLRIPGLSFPKRNSTPVKRPAVRAVGSSCPGSTQVPAHANLTVPEALRHSDVRNWEVCPRLRICRNRIAFCARCKQLRQGSVSCYT